MGTLRFLDAIKEIGLKDKTRFYQPSTSEPYGKVQEILQTEKNPFLPTIALRRRQALRLLDHRQLSRSLGDPRLQRHPLQPRISPLGKTFIIRNITRAAGRIKERLEDCLIMGNNDSKREEIMADADWKLAHLEKATVSI